MFINGIFSDGLELLNNPKLIQEGRRGCKSAANPGYTCRVLEKTCAVQALDA